jgi:hypothetical protein
VFLKGASGASTLATCDPGRDAGLASFIDSTLKWCGLNLVPPAYCPKLSWLGHSGKHDRLVIEIPNAHEKRKRKSDPQDLITLAIRAGRWIERVPHSALTQKFPSEWKAGVPKEIHNGLVLQALTPAERLTFAYWCSLYKIPKGKLNNVFDAIGIGLETLGRIGRGGRPIA